jgi:hypothetical protein
VKNKHEIIGVDFDGTLAVTKDIYPEIGEPIQEVLDYILDRQEHGAFLVLITMREGAALEKAVKWSKEQGIFFDAVNDNLQHMKNYFQNNPRKIFCTEYLDDHNIGGIEAVIEQIRKKSECNE